MLKRKKMLIVIGVVVLALGYLGYTSLAGAGSYYYEVGELMAQTQTLAGQSIRVHGEVAAGSIEQKGLNLRFVVTDGQNNLPVKYQGAVPDAFKTGAEITVEGRLDSSGVFEATTLMPKCPSKYIPEIS